MNTAISKSWSNRKSILNDEKNINENGYIDYNNFIDELLERVEGENV